MKTELVRQKSLTGSLEGTRKRSFIGLSGFLFLVITSSAFSQIASTCNTNPAQPGGSYSQQQESVLYGQGLDYAIGTISCPWTAGNIQCTPGPIPITLPAGAIPVTAFAWVEAYWWNGGPASPPAITGNGFVNGH